MAYGAAPNMLLFAPDGGAGFDLGGQDSFVDFLTSWNSTIAGQLGTSGAQNVIPPIHKGPMAVRATPLGRNGGVGLGQDSFVEFLTSWNTTIAGPLGTSGAHENCATDYGLNNGQEDEKKGSWSCCPRSWW